MNFLFGRRFTLLNPHRGPPEAAFNRVNLDYKDFKYKELIELLSADTRPPRLADSHGGQVGENLHPNLYNRINQ